MFILNGKFNTNIVFIYHFFTHSYHPYLFFNEDGCSITFVGFNVNENGDLMDPVKNQTIQKAIMTPQLYAGLQGNHVDFSENYYDWEKQKMIEKISMVMGIQNPFDPDPSYVLTVDNVIKILAILMKFRYTVYLFVYFVHIVLT